MKAVELRGVGEVIISSRPEPVPAAGELLLQVELVGLCGTDLNSYRGRNPLITYPRVLGHEIAATVLAGNELIQEGTRVTVSPYTSCGGCTACRSGRENACRENQTYGVQRDGAMTERLSVPAARVYPSTLSHRELCLVEPLTVGFHAIARAHVSSNDTVAVVGCGGVGMGAIAGSAFAGAHTIAVDMDDAKLATAAKAGASRGINSQREDVRERLRELTAGDGPTVVIEAVGSPETYRMAVEAVAFAGRVVYIGYAKQIVEFDTRLFVQKELDIRGSRNALAEDFRTVITMLEAHRFPVEETISALVPMDETPRALADWSAHPTNFTKILVQIGASSQVAA